MSEKILVTGASGMVGSRFVETHPKPDNLLSPDLDVFDMTRPENLAAYFAAHPGIGAVINLAAYTNVSEAEKQKEDKASLCYQLNVVGTQNLIDQIKDKDIYLIHISTDMVFPGDAADPGPYAEDHPVEADKNRLTWYGYTKALAERIVTAAFPIAAILRLIYPVVKEYVLKADYLRAPLAHYEAKKSLYPIFTDQQMNISAVDEICIILNRLLEERLAGIFHAGSSDITTPYQIMTQLFDLVHGHHDMVKPGSLAEFLKTTSNPTRYPRFGGLANRATQEKLGVKISTAAAIVDRLYGHLEK